MDKQDFIKWVRKMGPTYSASPQVLSDLSQIDLVAIVGPTGVGKTTLMKKLDIPLVKSDVTRERRSDEKKSDSYVFRTDYLGVMEDFKAGNYVQYVVSETNEFYGTRIESYPSKGPCTMAIVAAAIPSFKKLNFKSITQIYLMPPGYVEWMRRIGTMRTKDIRERINEAAGSVKMGILDENYHFVLNDDLDTAVSDVKKIIASEEISEHRAALARETADLLLKRMVGSEDDLYF